MDERKRSFTKLVPWIVISGLVIVSSLSFYYYQQSLNIKDPNKCMTTSMFKVKLCPGNGDYIYYKQVPKLFIRALVLAEDASFFSHKGLDWFEIKESFRRNLMEWKFARGGSTITQQLAKNMYLEPSKTPTRKFKEYFIAKQLEKKLSKAQILEKYVNVVEFGKNIYGLKAAARHYFYKNPSELNLLESVYLVSLLPSPRRYGSSFESLELSKINRNRMNIILGRMYRTKRITDETYVYAQMLIETEPWPFPLFEQGIYEEEKLSVEEELMMELGTDSTQEDALDEVPASDQEYEMNDDAGESAEDDSQESKNDLPAIDDANQPTDSTHSPNDEENEEGDSDAINGAETNNHSEHSEESVDPSASPQDDN